VIRKGHTFTCCRMSSKTPVSPRTPRIARIVLRVPVESGRVYPERSRRKAREQRDLLRRVPAGTLLRTSAPLLSDFECLQRMLVQAYGIPAEGEHWELLQRQFEAADDFYDTDELFHDDEHQVSRQRQKTEAEEEGGEVGNTEESDEAKEAEEKDGPEDFAETALMVSWYRPQQKLRRS